MFLENCSVLSHLKDAFAGTTADERFEMLLGAEGSLRKSTLVEAISVMCFPREAAMGRQFFSLFSRTGIERQKLRKDEIWFIDEWRDPIQGKYLPIPASIAKSSTVILQPGTSRFLIARDVMFHESNYPMGRPSRCTDPETRARNQFLREVFAPAAKDASLATSTQVHQRDGDSNLMSPVDGVELNVGEYVKFLKQVPFTPTRVGGLHVFKTRAMLSIKIGVDVVFYLPVVHYLNVDRLRYPYEFYVQRLTKTTVLGNHFSICPEPELPSFSPKAFTDAPRWNDDALRETAANCICAVFNGYHVFHCSSEKEDLRVFVEMFLPSRSRVLIDMGPNEFAIPRPLESAMFLPAFSDAIDMNSKVAFRRAHEKEGSGSFQKVADLIRSYS